MYLIFFALIALFQGSASADTITLATSPKYYLRLGYPTELEAQQSFQIANANISSVKIHLSRRGNVTMPVTISIRSTRTGPDLVATTISPTGLSTDYKNPTPITVLFNPTFVGAGERWVNVKTTIGSSSTYYQLVIGEYRAPLPGKLYQRNNVVSNRALMATIDFSTGAPPPPPPAQCGDGLDNDGDGKIDFGSSESNDPGCSSLTDNDETDSVPPPPPPPPSSVQGFGSATIGGACATCAVFTVTSLADSGIGTLRDALSGSNRNIVFAVAGTITLATDISVRNRANLTIDGSTAPGQGITVAGRGIDIHTSNNVIIRHMRIRNAGNDGISVRFNSGNVVIDHCSVTDSVDGAIDITEGAHDITVQWTILGHARPNWYDLTTRGMLLNNESQPAATNISLHHNFWINNYQRSPEVSTAALIDIRNNVFWDWGARATRFNQGGHGNVINNVYVKPESTNRDDALVLQSDSGPVHVAGNLGPEGQNVNALSTAASPLSVAPVTTDPAEGLDALIRASVGAFPRDSIDSAILQ